IGAQQAPGASPTLGAEGITPGASEEVAIVTPGPAASMSAGATGAAALGAPGTPVASTPAAPVEAESDADQEPVVQPGVTEPAEISTNPFVNVARDPLSTFAADVDTASYDIFRRDVERGVLPAPATVRLDEFVNYFDYDYP